MLFENLIKLESVMLNESLKSPKCIHPAVAGVEIREHGNHVYHGAHGGHGGKNLSQRIYAGRPHKIH